jgi:alpha-tubulin suppressor-like RCC1 family protein
MKFISKFWVASSLLLTAGCSSGLPKDNATDSGSDGPTTGPEDSSPSQGPGIDGSTPGSPEASPTDDMVDGGSSPDAGSDATLPVDSSIPPDAAMDAADGEAGPNLNAALSVSVGGAASGNSVAAPCALTAGGNLKCWQVSGTISLTTVPTLVNDVHSFAGGGNWESFDCAVTTAGAAWCFGDNASGNLGNGGTTASSVPVPVTGLSSGVAAVAVGCNYAACAVTTSGDVQCWGDNSSGELGNGTTASTSDVPVQVTGFPSAVTAVSVGTTSACALTVGGSVWCWGTGSDGQLGNGMSKASTAPVQVTGLTSGVTAISVGSNYACAVASGAVECWGQNGFGTSNVPAQVMGLTSGATAVSVGFDAACAIVNGGLQCWGSNATGQLGNNSNTSSAVPVPVTTLSSGVTSVSVGCGYATVKDVYACATTAGGGVFCWGNNSTGSTPVHISGFPE